MRYLLRKVNKKKEVIRFENQVIISEIFQIYNISTTSKLWRFSNKFISFFIFQPQESKVQSRSLNQQKKSKTMKLQHPNETLYWSELSYELSDPFRSILVYGVEKSKKLQQKWRSFINFWSWKIKHWSKMPKHFKP